MKLNFYKTSSMIDIIPAITIMPKFRMVFLSWIIYTLEICFEKNKEGDKVNYSEMIGDEE